ncbi:MAG: purine/pyrimidine permease [Bacteroidales bacterium]|nr:purine/pyrimidine permease [Bacteroidales bacterium]
MKNKPSNLIYGLNDKPPIGTTILLGLQHVMIFFIGLIMPVIIVNELGDAISHQTARSFISLTMIAGGITTILQASKKGPIGSGYLCPSVSGPSYLSASLMAVHTGGLSLLFGMTGFVGLVESLFSRVMHKLRFMFPPEVTGVVVALVGIVVVPLSVRSLVGLGHNDTISSPHEIIVGIVTFSIMVGLNIYSKGKLKLYCTLIGMISGYLLAYILGIIPQSVLHHHVGEPDFFAIPYIRNMSWSFDFAFVIPFVIAALCSTLKTVGDIATCQKINDKNWHRIDMKSASGGILADGIGGIIPGLIGGFGQSTSSSNVGLSVATASTSRRIAYSAGILFILLAFFPQLANIFIIMPKPVMGATLIFAVSFMIIQGFQIMMSRMLDARKIFVIGASLIFGLSADMVPEVYQNVHHWIKPVFSSSLSLGAITAVVLNLILRIGISKHQTLELKITEDYTSKIFDFMDKQGSLWGARKEVIYSAASAMNEVMESVVEMKLATDKISVKLSFDELNLNVDINYLGKPLEISQEKPSKEDLEIDKNAISKLSGYMIKQYSDKITTSFKDKHCNIKLHFEH